MKRHDYIEKCPYCGKYMTAEQAESHVCASPFNDVKEIPILYLSKVEKQNGDTIFLARGRDGILYRLSQYKCETESSPPHKSLKLPPSFLDDENPDKLPEPGGISWEEKA